MKITITKLPGSRVEVLGTLPAADLEPYIKQMTRSFVDSAELPGFRKGKAPETMVIANVGEIKILERAAEKALQGLWPKILEEHHIEAIGSAEFHLLKLARGNDLEWKTTVAILPEITLPDYKAIAKKINSTKKLEQIEITDKEINETLEYIRKSRARDDGTLPELSDQFAQSLGNFSTLEALKNNIRDGIRLEKEGKNKESHRMKIITEIALAATIDIPTIMIDAEREKMARELRTSIEDMGLTWDTYLAHLKKTEEELKAHWTEDAQKRIRTGMALREIARHEHIEPQEKEIQERIEWIMKPYTEEERKNLDPERIRDYAMGIIKNDTVFQFLETC